MKMRHRQQRGGRHGDQPGRDDGGEMGPPHQLAPRDLRASGDVVARRAETVAGDADRQILLVFI
jgi:hypothetical protein